MRTESVSPRMPRAWPSAWWAPTLRLRRITCNVRTTSTPSRAPVPPPPHTHYFRTRYASTDQLTYQINPAAPQLHTPEVASRLFRTVGRLLAKALLDKQIVSVSLNKPLLKHLLALPVCFADLELYDAGLYRNLSWMLSAEREPGEVRVASPTGSCSSQVLPRWSVFCVSEENVINRPCALSFSMRALPTGGSALPDLLRAGRRRGQRRLRGTGQRRGALPRRCRYQRH